ncbi:GNAT family N-acetyltransferase [Corynebacterium lubricantis]|uniref:GNAT family N-acetyltransferase n=1 Tax=Corynebacterium lubricantis TaxID=541095 RepID=UPI000380CC0E|nr:GNAT family N-acetyltransferase [Corynebacterium lubricantis]
MLSIRPAEIRDVPAIHEMIVELAVYEKEPDAVIATPADLERHLFAGRPAVYANVAEADGAVVGFSLYFLNYSTWEGRHGIWLEDLYVKPAFRGHGYGKALLTELARIAVKNDYRRVEWAVLKWNTPSIEFYRSLGASAMEEWDTFRLTGQALERLGAAPFTSEQA